MYRDEPSLADLFPPPPTSLLADICLIGENGLGHRFTKLTEFEISIFHSLTLLTLHHTRMVRTVTLNDGTKMPSLGWG